jgi:beta-1,4-mannosyltransferase
MDFSDQKAYIYPNTSRNGGLTNPYIFNFIDSLEGKINFVNRNKPSESGIFDLLKYINKIHFLFLNWPEDIPDKKAGFIQTLLLLACINYLKFRKVKIVYTLHNKESHNKAKSILKKYLRKFIIRKADLILTHAREGIEIVRKISNNPNQKIAFINHPVLSKIDIKPDVEKKYDVLIWGTVEPYKGIDKFISFVNEHQLYDIKILIAGRIKN